MQLNQDFSNLANRSVLVPIVGHRFPEGDRMSVENDRLVNVENANCWIVNSPKPPSDSNSSARMLYVGAGA